ncbi:MAG: NAD(P)-dependent oxidoreductase [Phycisphaerae bacterium]|nr:NAD(P)-dependent oxidoreductase [Phycisphaerae bacterium]
MDRLSGKTAFLTAAGQGIGRATAIAFAREGARVIATDINEATLETLQSTSGSIETFRLDVMDQSMVTSVISEIGPVDILFNCAGFVHHGTILDCTEEEFDHSFDLNVKSVYRITRAMIPAMIESGGGSIINVASVASSIKGAKDRYVYGATKAALVGMTRAIAIDFVDKGIRCNAICPGTIQSPSLDQRIAAQGDPEQARAAFIARQPMGRIGTPEEVAELAVYLAGDESGYTTGTIHVIDGGWST